jgi:holo-[acyl-carrier protein] synthase
MGLRVGVDLARIDEVASSISRFGDRYLKRIFTPHELECCQGEPTAAAAGLAARFAAKEATIKVLRVQGAQPDWRSMEVWRDQTGFCEIRLTREAARLAAEESIQDMAVSLTHEGQMAAAVVVATCREMEN